VGGVGCEWQQRGQIAGCSGSRIRMLELERVASRHAVCRAERR